MFGHKTIWKAIMANLKYHQAAAEEIHEDLRINRLMIRELARHIGVGLDIVKPSAVTRVEVYKLDA